VALADTRFAAAHAHGGGRGDRDEQLTSPDLPLTIPGKIEAAAGRTAELWFIAQVMRGRLDVREIAGISDTAVMGDIDTAISRRADTRGDASTMTIDGGTHTAQQP
jgi:hypothetical protein